MDYFRLFDFMEAAQCGSIQEAAKHLDVSPATLSARIYALEKSIGHSLLQHSSGTLSLTESGKLLLRDAQEIHTAWNEALERLERFDPEHMQAIRIGLLGPGLPPRLEACIQQLYELFPHLQVSFQDDTTCDLASEIQKGGLDLAFTCSLGQYANPALKVRSLFSTQMCIVVHREHRLAQNNAISMEELEGETFCLYPALKDDTLRQLEQKLLERAKISYSIRAENSCKAFYLHALSSVSCVAFCPWIMRDHIPDGTVVIPLRDPLPVTISILYHAENSSPILHTMVNLLQKARY